MGLLAGVVKQRRGSLAQSYPQVSSSSMRTAVDRAYGFERPRKQSLGNERILRIALGDAAAGVKRTR
jgi:hypothetical protein